MIAWITRLFRRHPQTDVAAFIDRTHTSRALANRERKASIHATRQLRQQNESREASWMDRPVVDRFRGQDEQ